MKRFIAIWILLSVGLNIWQMDRIRDLEEKKPMVIYKADNVGAEVFGRKRTTREVIHAYNSGLRGVRGYEGSV